MTVGDSALAAVGSSGTIHFFIFGFVMGLTHGFGIFFSQAFGAKKMKKLEEYICSAIVLSILIGVAATIVSILFIRQIFVFMQTPRTSLRTPSPISGSFSLASSLRS